MQVLVQFPDLASLLTLGFWPKVLPPPKPPLPPLMPPLPLNPPRPPRPLGDVPFETFSVASTIVCVFFL